MAAPRVAALLLTGGASRRMGRDKAALVVDGDRLADRTAALLCQVGRPVVEVGPGYTSLPCTCEDPPGSGPLAAVAAGGDWLGCRSDPTLVLATDLPRLTLEFLHRLIDYPAPGPEYCVVPRDAAGRAQPLCARYSPAALARATELVAAGHRSMNALLQVVAVTWLDPVRPDDVLADDVLADIDTPADWAALEAGPR